MHPRPTSKVSTNPGQAHESLLPGTKNIIQTPSARP